MFKKLSFLVFLLFVFQFVPANYCGAQDYNVEKISDYSSQIIVEKAGTLLVTEKISVNATGDQIKHGIYRDFPTIYKDKFGNSYKIKFQIISAKKDGSAELFHYEDLSNGVRIYLGDPNVIIAPKAYIYELSYRVDRELGFFSNHDELYWNVTGSGWSFDIEKSEATVILPFNLNNSSEVIKATAYSGIVGSADSTGVTWNISSDGENNIVTFNNPNNISKGQDFTIVVGWPKGLVNEPTPYEKFIYFLEDNISFEVGVLGLIILLLYFYIIWKKFGKDPKKESIIPIYEPPAELFPSAVRFLLKASFDVKCFLSEIINLAVGGYIKIEKKRVNFNLIKIKEGDNKLNEIQGGLLKLLFASGDVLELGSYDSSVLDSQTYLSDSLKKTYGIEYFTKNSGYFGIGVILSFILMFSITIIENAKNAPVLIFFIIWLSMWTASLFVLYSGVADAWGKVASEQLHKFKKIIPAIFITLFALPFFAAEFIVVFVISSFLSLPLTILFLCVIIINIIFYFLLWQYTEKGAKLVNEIKGFKWFLSVTEKDRMNFFNPPEKTPELFEKYLPYAIALGVENEWADQFVDVFVKQDMAGRHPLWYPNSIYGAGLLSDLSSSLASSVASSTTPPGSRSGFGGGGGSGGGGGGGGGGGW